MAKPSLGPARNFDLNIEKIVTVQSGPNDHIGRLLSSAGRRNFGISEN